MNNKSSYSEYIDPPGSKAVVKRPRRFGKKPLVWTGVVVLLIGLTASVVWAMREYNQRKLLASLKEDPRRAFEAARDGRISREDARDLMRETFEQRMNETMDGFFALPVGPQRTAYLDKLIDEQQARMREWQSRAATQPSWRDRGPTSRPTTRPDERRDRGGDQVARMRDRIQSGNPARSAQRAEFMSAMRQRMAERGMQFGRGGFGGGFGGGRGGGPRGGGGGGGGGR